VLRVSGQRPAIGFLFSNRTHCRQAHPRVATYPPCPICPFCLLSVVSINSTLKTRNFCVVICVLYHATYSVSNEISGFFLFESFGPGIPPSHLFVGRYEQIGVADPESKIEVLQGADSPKKASAAIFCASSRSSQSRKSRSSNHLASCSGVQDSRNTFCIAGTMLKTLCP